MMPSTVVNLWFIKHTNGLFHYGLDYACALREHVGEIWLRSDDMVAPVRARLPDVEIKVLSGPHLLRALAGARRRGSLLFTPSSHPIAFLRKQVVVVHDSFPFLGREGRMKRNLFHFAAATSGCITGYVNRSDARAFLENLGLPHNRMLFLPNAIGPDPVKREVRITRQHRVFGLFGSDSPKKNYDALFAAAEQHKWASPVEWRIFGHANAYTRRLVETYSASHIVVVESDEMTMDAFLDSIDVAVSPATGEGFARPIAMALMRGVPTYLLDTPIFREFYAGSAKLCPSIIDLVKDLSCLPTGDFNELWELQSAERIRDCFAKGIADLTLLAK